MAKYAIFFSYTPEALSAMIKNPSDRSTAARQVVALNQLSELTFDRQGTRSVAQSHGHAPNPVTVQQSEREAP